MLNSASAKPWRSGNALRPEEEKAASLLESQVEAVRVAISSRTTLSSRSPKGIEAALEWVRQRKWDQARAYLTRETETVQQDYAANWLLGDVFVQLGETEQAIQAYTYCIALRPEIALAYFVRGSVHFNAQRFDLAAQDFQEAVRRAPNWHWARVNRAIALQRLGDLQAALEEANQAIDAGVANVSVYWLRSSLHAALGNLAQEGLDRLSALACEPQSEEDWIDRGLLHLTVDPREASNDFQKALQIKPRSVEARQKLAYLHSEVLGEREPALKWLNELIEISPRDATHRAGRAVLLGRSGKYREAIADLDACAALKPNDPMVQYQIASGYGLLVGQIGKNPGAAADSAERGDCLQKCLSWFRKSIQLDPNILAVAESDSDMDAVRLLPEFQTILKAYRILQGGQPTPPGQTPE